MTYRDVIEPPACPLCGLAVGWWLHRESGCWYQFCDEHMAGVVSSSEEQH